MSDNTINTDVAANPVDDLVALFSNDVDNSDVDSEEEQSRDDSDYDDEDEHESDDSDDSDDDGQDDEDDDSTDDDDDDSDGSHLEDFDNKDFVVVVDGEEITVKGNELKAGYMRQANYTKKTQEVSEAKRELSQERDKVIEQANIVRFQAHSKLEQFEEAVKQSGGWDKIRTTYSPEQVDQFTQLYVAAQTEAQAADGIINEYTAAKQQYAQEEIANIFTDMSKTIPGFTMDTVNNMDSYLNENGFTADMIYGITTRSAWDMIYKAMMYDQAQAKSAKAVKSGNKEKVETKKHHSTPTKAPAKKTDSKSRKLNKALERQKKSGGDSRSTEDALIELLKG